MNTYQQRRKKERQQEQEWEAQYWQEYTASEQKDRLGNVLGVIAIVLLVLGSPIAFYFFFFDASALTVLEKLHGLWFLLPGSLSATVSLLISTRHIEGSEGMDANE